MKYIYIQHQNDFLSYLGSFKDKKDFIIALDIEAELNRHAYGEKLCLIQIFDGTDRVLVDPFDIDDKTLKIFFEDRNTLKVMYDASSDLSLLKNTYNLGIKCLLDLRPAVDLLGLEKKDLHSVIASELGVILREKSKYQKYNWTIRPIDRRAINYAINDVLYLLKLKDALLKKLYVQKQLDVYFLKNLQVQTKDYLRNPDDKYRKMKGFSRLSREEKRVFRNVFDTRDKYARLSNMPPHNIINNSALIRIVQDRDSIEELRFPRRLSADIVERIVRDLKEITDGKNVDG